MLERETERIISGLNLSKNRKNQVIRFLETVSFYRLKPYVCFVKNNTDISNYLKSKNPNIKDSWDSITELYRYNIKLSIL